MVCADQVGFSGVLRGLCGCIHNGLAGWIFGQEGKNDSH